MSIHLMSLVWKVKFPSQTQKLLMMRIADFAHEDGTGVYPAIDTIAEDIGASRRQTQYAIKALESCTLIDRIKLGGSKKQKTNVWQINNDMLVQLALREVSLNGAHDKLEAVENKGAIIAPRDLLRVQLIAERVQSATQKGAISSTQTTINHHLESSGACADARDGSRTAPAGKPITSLTVERGDASWSAWMERLKPEQIRAAEQRGRIEVSKRWPVDDAVLHTKLKHDHTDRMLGEGDAA